jgi:hypothetical protein
MGKDEGRDHKEVKIMHIRRERTIATKCYLFNVCVKMHWVNEEESQLPGVAKDIGWMILHNRGKWRHDARRRPYHNNGQRRRKHEES